MNEKEFDKVLSVVEKPGRYIGMEINSCHKDWDGTDARLLLCYPDLYEVGMSNHGLGILYDIVNRREDALAERVYAPAADMEELLRQKKILLFSLESKKPVKDFDILGFTLQYELAYTNVLNILDMSGIPLHSSERDGQYPLVIAGGPCTCNPEPLADFIDVFVIGDGEEAIGALIDVYKKYRSSPKRELLKKIAEAGFYVPALYEVAYNSDGTVKQVVPGAGAPGTVKKSTVDIGKYPGPVPLVPLINTVHKRLTVEIQRGCPNNCRFCQARAYYYPFRVRDKASIMDIIDRGLEATGYDEISLSSLSTMDYPQIKPLVAEIVEKYGDSRISVSLSSLRPDRFSLEIACSIRQARKTGLTFAVESGSKSLRTSINKLTDDEVMLSTIADAHSQGWKLVKLYFMIGLPNETKEDVDTIISTVNSIRKLTGMKLNITVANFVPKPHTPFQWVGQAGVDELREKANYLRDRLKGKVKFHDTSSSLLEAVFARGDRKLGRVIEEAWKLGCRFDQWTEHFRYGLWEKAFSTMEVSMAFYAERARQEGEVFPWGHIDCGISRQAMLKEFNKSNGRA